MTHDDVLALLALMGRDTEAVSAITYHFNIKQWQHVTRELAVETSHGISSALTHMYRARRAHAELALAEAFTMGET